MVHLACALSEAARCENVYDLVVAQESEPLSGCAAPTVGPTASSALSVASDSKQKTSERAPLIARARCDSDVPLHRFLPSLLSSLETPGTAFKRLENPPS